MAITAMTPSKHVSNVASAFLFKILALLSLFCCSLFKDDDADIDDDPGSSDFMATSNAGKAWSGKVKMTAIEYASCTVVAKLPLRDAVKAV